MEEFVGVVLSTAGNGNEVLNADAVTVCLIETWFVAHYHAWLENNWVLLHADAVRTFVTTQEVPDTMTCTVKEVHPVLPKRHAGKDVQVNAAYPLGEFCGRQGKVPFQHQRVVALLVVGGVAQCDCARHVGGAVKVL